MKIGVEKATFPDLSNEDFIELAAETESIRPEHLEWLFEARHGRIPPGHGQLPLEQILSGFGPNVPISIEFPNTALSESMGARAYAKYLLERSKEVIARRKISN